MSAMKLSPRRCAALVLAGAALVCVLPASAQSTQLRGVTPPPTVSPQLGNNNRMQGVKSSIDDSAKLGRDIDAASRRVQADGIDNEIQRRDRDLRNDRIHADQVRAATSDPYRAAAVDRSYELREADTRRRVQTLQQQRDQLQQPPPAAEAPPVAPPVAPLVDDR